MPKAYSIKNWSKTFETADSRRFKTLPWISTPTNQGGKRRRRLVRRDNGAALFGAWNALAQVAATCPVRGILADSDGPLDANDLEILTDIKAELFDELFHVLTDLRYKIGWLQLLNWSPPSPEPMDTQPPNDNSRATVPEPEPDITKPYITEPVHATDSDSIAAHARFSDSDSTPSGIRCESEFFQIIERLSRGDNKQHKADFTQARSWWADHIWPSGLDPPIAYQRFLRFKELSVRAANNARNKPMAYLNKLIPREIKR